MPARVSPGPVFNLISKDFQGLNIERGVLVRPINSWTKLENFDLVKNGVIRKVGGNQKLTVDPIDDGVIAFRDWQYNPDVVERLVMVTPMGQVYVSGYGSEILPQYIADLYSPLSKLDEAPFLVSLPFDKWDSVEEVFKKVQFLVITVGNKDYPKYFDGASVYNLGIPNPGDQYTVPYEHSVAAPQVLYTNVPNGVMFRGTSPNSTDGIYLGIGRRYRASWYNPDTGHDSSMFPWGAQTGVIEDAASGYALTKPIESKPLGLAKTTPSAPYLMAVPLFLGNLANGGFDDIPIPQAGYTKLRFWATRDGDVNYYLLPTVYDKYGRVASDKNGAINFIPLGLDYGIQSLNTLGGTPVFDGYVPIKYATAANANLDGIINWVKMTEYNTESSYSVNGAGQTGNDLIVTLDSGTRLLTGAFKIKGDDTVYRILSIGGSGPDYVFHLDEDLATSPADNAELEFIFIPPVADTDLLTPWTETTGTNTDRQHDGPPKASWGAVYQNMLFLQNAEDKTEIRYSRIGHYEDFPPDNVFRFVQADYDPVTAILSSRQVGLVSEGADSGLIVAKQRSSSKITGTNQTNFAINSLFSETGIVHKRAAIVVGGFTIGLTRQGLELLEGQRPVFIGAVIKDIVDTIMYDEYGPCFTTDRRNNQILMGVQTIPELDQASLPEDTINTIILVREPRYNQDGSLASPFSTATIPGANLGCICESGFGNDVRILASTNDGDIIQLLVEGLSTDANGDTLVATAETQLLPQDQREARKIFRRIQFEGNIVDETWDENDDTSAGGWKIQFEIDGNGYWTPVRTMYKETLIGLVGKQIKIRIIHDGEIQNDEAPMLSNFMLEYVVIGEAR